MATTRSALTEDDIRTLVKGATPDERAAAAHKLCTTIETAPLSAAERELAGEILRIMAADASELVRRSVATTLSRSARLPRDVALKLARDVESVALPVLTFSPAFTDDDLAEIVRLGGPVRQAAVARRPTLSPKITGVIAEIGVERAVQAACANPGAEFSEAALAKVLERFEASERVLAAVAYRAALPLSVTEKLVQLVAGEVREHLIAHHGVESEIALQLAMETGERATVDLVEEAGRAADMKRFVADLAGTQRLTASLLLRGVVSGQMSFFEWGVAELAGVPHHRTWLMIHDAGALGLRAIYERACLPARLFPAFRAAVDTYHSVEFDGGAQDKARFQEKLLQRFLTQPQPAMREDVDYLLARMDQVADERRAEALTEYV
jgi:uncharacterized protein (DUF2336 family)